MACGFESHRPHRKELLRPLSSRYLWLATPFPRQEVICPNGRVRQSAAIPAQHIRTVDFKALLSQFFHIGLHEPLDGDRTDFRQADVQKYGFVIRQTLLWFLAQSKAEFTLCTLSETKNRPEIVSSNHAMAQWESACVDASHLDKGLAVTKFTSLPLRLSWAGAERQSPRGNSTEATCRPAEGPPSAPLRRLRQIRTATRAARDLFPSGQG